ncbi:MAG: TetR family transcriptional regulator [Dehalococcoidia bacterium]|nr:TetR family transcriptional regulator [Dehalococcoidia bacterium]
MASEFAQRQVNRVRSHDTVRAEIARAAVRSFLRNGFEQTTVDDIAAAAGVSRRTYFRYFGSKDESLLSQMQEVGVFVAERLARVPETVPPLVALREAFFQVESTLAEFRDRQRALATMLRTNPRVHGALLVVQHEWVDELASILTTRHGGQERMADRFHAHMAVTAWNLAVDRWLDDPASTLRDQAMDVFRELDELVLAPEHGATCEGLGG